MNIKKDYLYGYAYCLTESEVERIPAFDGKNVAELQPQILIYKNRTRNYFRVSIQLGCVCEKIIGVFHIVKDGKCYPFEQSFNGILNYLIDKIDNSEWEGLIKEHDKTEDSYDGFIKRIADELL